jgi:hypothetical protein
MNVRNLITVVTIGAMSLAAATPLAAAPISPASIAQGASELQQVQYHHGGPGRPGFRGGYRGGGYRGGHHHGGGGAGAAVLGGLAAGAIIGGAIAASRANAESQAYCAQRFRSYDPGSGTYLGTDGMRHACP